MNCSGYEFKFKHVILLSYSGLRGAVGLCLALLVYRDKDIPDNKEKSKDLKTQMLFFSAGIVLLTLVINATTTGFLIRKLELTKES